MTHMGVCYCPHSNCHERMYPLSILNDSTGHFVCLNHDTPYHEERTRGGVTQFSRELNKDELAGLKRVQERYAEYSSKILVYLEKVE